MLPEFHQYRIENTNACGYRCMMCPREKQKRKIGFMSTETFKQIIDRLPKKVVPVHLHGYGEPLLDPNLNEKITYVKKTTPMKTFIITTLGVDLNIEKIKDLLDAGLDVMDISFYGYNQENYKRIHGVDRFELVIKNIRMLDRVLKNYPRKIQVFLKVQTHDLEDIKQYHQCLDRLFLTQIKIIGTPSWHNYSNGRSYNLPSSKLCPVIKGNRKGILHVTWDGKVIPCCYDFNASIVFGNLLHQSLEDIFSSLDYQKFIDGHLRGDLKLYPACQGCEKNDL